MFLLKKTNLKYFLILFSFTLNTNALDNNKSVDPYENAVFVTNTIAWPYDSNTYGTSSFQAGNEENEDTKIISYVKRNGFSFSNSFLFGVAGSAYQYEGHHIAPTKNSAGVAWSIWDVFSEKGSWLNPNKNNIAEVPPTSLYTEPNGSNAINGFDTKTYQQDILKAKELGAKTYRLSISWPRMFPKRSSSEPDPEAVAYYQGVLSFLNQNNITPLITLYHWDLPAWLYNFGDKNISEKNKTYGWLDMHDAKDNVTLKEFQKYVAACYKKFGAYTPYFSTFNEPLTFTNSAFIDGVHAPGQNAFDVLQNKNPALYGSNKNESLERIPYLQAINIIKAHDIAYKTIHNLYTQYYKEYNLKERPVVSIVLNSDWAEPFRITKSCENKQNYCYNKDDIKASKLNMDFMLGWWLDPVMFGTWPKSMDFIYSTRITSVGLKQDNSCLLENGKPVDCSSNSQNNLVRLADDIAQGGTLDNIALNHYTGYFVADINWAQKNYGKNSQEGLVPPNQYGGTPASTLTSSGWQKDQNNFSTQFRYYKFGNKIDSSRNHDNEKAFVIGNSGNKPWMRQTWFVYRKLLNYVNHYYLNSSRHLVNSTKSGKLFSDLDIFLTENGTSLFQESQKLNPLPTEIPQDNERIKYLVGNLGAVQQAIADGVPVKLYTYWSLADNFEWSEGYDTRFGLLWIDYTNLNRIPKQSYFCYQSIIKNKILDNNSCPF